MNAIWGLDMKLFQLHVAILCLASASVAVADVKRDGSGRPDLSGTYDTATLTPTQRPEMLGEVEYLYPWIAKTVNWGLGLATELAQNYESDPDRGAPQEGGDGQNAAGAGGVGGYNFFWVDPGDELGFVNGKVPTSIVYEPANGRYPETREGYEARLGVYYQSFTHQNTGHATWLAEAGPGPFDGPESLAPSERCLISFASTVPTLPSLYNNYKRIIQTDTHIMILQEMVHHARVIRIDSEHTRDTNRSWLGDSVGYWEGDTLVVETKNFKKVSGLPGATDNLHVVERFTLQEDGEIYYDFTVNDPTVWTEPWSGRYMWRSKPADKVYEYACHEGNYAMGNILRGARLLESEWDGKVAESGASGE